jgi:hypothetical protein
MIQSKILQSFYSSLETTLMCISIKLSSWLEEYCSFCQLSDDLWSLSLNTVVHKRCKFCHKPHLLSDLLESSREEHCWLAATNTMMPLFPKHVQGPWNWHQGCQLIDRWIGFIVGRDCFLSSLGNRNNSPWWLYVNPTNICIQNLELVIEAYSLLLGLTPHVFKRTSHWKDLGLQS